MSHHTAVPNSPLAPGRLLGIRDSTEEILVVPSPERARQLPLSVQPRKREEIRILLDVPGLAGEPGFLLLAPPSEALRWDIEHEISSRAQRRIDQGEAWWIELAYLSTAEIIVERFTETAQVSSLLQKKQETLPPRPEATPQTRASAHAWTQWIRGLLTRRWRWQPW